MHMFDLNADGIPMLLSYPCRVGQMPGVGQRGLDTGWTNSGWTDKFGLDRGWIDLSRWYGLYTSCTQVVYKVGRFAVNNLLRGLFNHVCNKPHVYLTNSEIPHRFPKDSFLRANASFSA
jgi:hypothetical protein